jgi:hypothetical protein
MGRGMQRSPRRYPPGCSMHGRLPTVTRGAILVAVLAATGAFAALALANVIVYQNSLATKADGKELHHFEGRAKDCSRHVRGGSLLVQVTAKTTCGYRLPLEGDKRQPNHALHARFKLARATPNDLRRSTYVGLAVRLGGGTGYTLRVLPQRHQFKLRRSPKGEGFPVSGRESGIKPVDGWNDLRLQAFGTKIVAVVNGKQIASVTDAAAGDVTGRKAEVFVGSNKASKAGAFGRIDDVRLTVPSP